MPLSILELVLASIGSKVIGTSDMNDILSFIIIDKGSIISSILAHTDLPGSSLLLPVNFASPVTEILSFEKTSYIERTWPDSFCPYTYVESEPSDWVTTIRSFKILNIVTSSESTSVPLYSIKGSTWITVGAEPSSSEVPTISNSSFNEELIVL